MPNSSKSIGQRVSEVLSQLKILQKISGDKEIATQLGYKSASSISEIKNNRALPSKELIELLTSKYNVSKDYLLEGIGSEFNSQESVIIKDYEAKTMAMIIKMDAKTDVILSALAEVLAKMNGQLSKTVLDQLLSAVNSLIQDKTKESL